MPEDIDVWIADIASCGARLLEIERERRLLTDPEMTHAAAMRDADDRNRWIAAHVALHLVLADRVGRRVSFVEGAPTGKPRVVDWDGDFSLAHSGSLALIAVANRGRIGIDVEVRRAVKMNARRATLIETAGMALVPDAPLFGGDGDLRFLAAWTRLEAVAKLRGTGIGALLEELGLTARGPGADVVAAAACHLMMGGPEPLAVHDIDLKAFDAVATVATSSAQGSAPAIRDLSRELGRLAG